MQNQSDMSILCWGEVLWDVAENERESLAGAPLNVAVGLMRLGDGAVMLSAVGADDRGQRAVRQLRAYGCNAQFVRQIPGRPTGMAKITMDANGHPSFTIARPAAFDFLRLEPEDWDAIAALHPQWLYFGTLAQVSDPNAALLARLAQQFPGISRFYDLNLRAGHWNFPLIQQLARLATVCKLNEQEARELFTLTTSEPFSLPRFCRAWARTYDIPMICVTLGGAGCAVYTQDSLQYFPGFPLEASDPVGAGDACSAGFLHGMLHGWPLAQTAALANALGAIVASRDSAIPAWRAEEAQALIQARP